MGNSGKHLAISTLSLYTAVSLGDQLAQVMSLWTYVSWPASLSRLIDSQPPGFVLQVFQCSLVRPWDTPEFTPEFPPGSAQDAARHKVQVCNKNIGYEDNTSP